MKKSWHFYAKLNQKKFRLENNLFYVEGVRACREALLSGDKISAAFISESFSREQIAAKLAPLFEHRSLKPQILSNSNFRRLTDTENPQGIALVLEIPKDQISLEKLIKNQNFVLILDGIRDPGNMGTLIRTADWFGFKLIFASIDSVDFYNPKVIRASMGSILRIHLIQGQHLPETISFLQKSGFEIIRSTVKGGKNLQDICIHPPAGLILGGEARGITADLEKMGGIEAHIPKRGDGESLNVAVAGGILMNYFSG